VVEAKSGDTDDLDVLTLEVGVLDAIALEFVGGEVVGLAVGLENEPVLGPEEVQLPAVVEPDVPQRRGDLRVGGPARRRRRARGLIWRRDPVAGSARGPF
jgi:hypothetical protein